MFLAVPGRTAKINGVKPLIS